MIDEYHSALRSFNRSVDKVDSVGLWRIMREQWYGWSRFWIRGVGISLLAGLFGILITIGLHLYNQGDPQLASASVSLGPFCRQTQGAAILKEQLRLQAQQSDVAWAEYTQLLGEHKQALEQCRQTQWPRIQAIWLRLYPCDANSGNLDWVFDQIVNLGYNRVFIETFYDGQVVLPGKEGSPWPGISPNIDLLDMAFKSARRRGLSPYAWIFSLNYGYSYSQIPSRLSTLARNGEGDTSFLDPNTASPEDLDFAGGPDQVFVDPFNPQARQDYQGILQQILRRQPDGVLFDYIRYPRRQGAASVATKVKDLWIYGEYSQQEFIQLGLNPLTQILLDDYLQQGYVTLNHLTRLYQQFPGMPIRWRQPGQSAQPDPIPSPNPTPEFLEISTSPLPNQATPSPTPPPTPPPAARLESLQPQLWELAVDFAHQGILDYLKTISQPVQKQGIPAGTVFFPDGNTRVGEMGFDSRLQPWDQFDPSLEWHPMAYARCKDIGCIGDQVSTVLKAASAETFVCPAIAGLWGQALDKRPMLEVQMRELQQRFPQLPCVSHFAFSWIAPQSDQSRKVCNAP